VIGRSRQNAVWRVDQRKGKKTNGQPAKEDFAGSPVAPPGNVGDKAADRDRDCNEEFVKTVILES
jgi:hypothetical protein